MNAAKPDRDTTGTRRREPAIFWVAPTINTATSVGLIVALADDGPSPTVTVTGILCAVIAIALTILTMRHQATPSPRNGSSRRIPFERIDAPVAALLNVLAVVALIALWLTPAALFYVALGLVPIAFACLIVISWPD